MNSPFVRRALVVVAACLALGVADAQSKQGGGGGAGGGGGEVTVSGDILLKLQSTANLQPLLARYPLALVSALGPRPLYRVQVIDATPVATVIAALLLEPGVQLAEANPFNQTPEARKNIAWAIGTEVDYRAQWAPQAMHLAEAQARGTGAGVRIAVLDTGVDFTHPALAGHLVPGYDFVDGDADASEGGTPADAAYGHGTHVAGLIALAAPGARIMPLRVLSPNGSGNMWAIAQAVLYAIDPDGDPNTDDGAQIINLSLGSLSRSEIFDTIELLTNCGATRNGAATDITDPGYNSDRIRCARLQSAVIVVAAGNDASASIREFPAAQSLRGLISVAASDATHHLATFSNSGNWIQSAAPGDHVTSTMPGGGYATWSGTSMAAPLVTGAMALARGLNPALRPQDLVQRAIDTSALLCGTKLRQVDALGMVSGVRAPDLACP